MSHRRQQLESSLQRSIGQLIAAGLGDPRIQGMITVTGVHVSPDGRHADVGISVLPDDKQDLTLHGLRSAAGHIQVELRRMLRARAIPQLNFQFDPSLKKQARVLGAIQDAVRDLPPEVTEPETGEPMEPKEDQPS